MIENLQFDQFQRYSIASQLIKLLFNHGPPNLLEIGGNVHGNLKKFIPKSHLVALDKEPFSFEGKDIKAEVGSGTDLSYSDQTFDFVVSLDVLEHIENEDHESFINECYRVANRGVIFSFPCGKATQTAEREVNKFWRKYFSKDHIWLKEHFERGLPELEKVVSLAEKAGGLVEHLWHGNLALWIPMIECCFMKEAYPRIALRMLLKSCAMPPVNVPRLSIFWAWKNCRSSFFWPVMSRRLPR